MRVSVVIPTLDEEARIGARLQELARIPGLYEVIVADGGSIDRTAELVEAAGARLVRTRRGRGPQLNAGAAEATGDVLLFVHADCALPGDVLSWIEHALRDEEVVAGAFRLRTVAERPSRLSPLLRIGDLRSHRTGLPYGDQALFVRRRVFEQVGGYPDQPLMEDVELARRLRGVGSLRVVRARVRVSGRRFLAAPVRTLLAWNLFPVLYAAGVPPELLERGYSAVR